MIYRTLQSANKALNSAQINTLERLETFIPFNYLYSEGIIFNVPHSFEVKEMLEHTEPQYKVVKMGRSKTNSSTYNREH